MFSINTVLIIFMIIWFLYGPYQQNLMNIFRQKFFDIRNRLFLDLPHDDTCRDLREYFNIQIRFMHKISLWRIIFVGMFIYKTNHIANEEIVNLLDKISKHQNSEKLLKLLNRSHHYLTLFVLLRSPLILILLLPIVVLASILFSSVSKLVRKIKDPMFYPSLMNIH